MMTLCFVTLVGWTMGFIFCCSLMKNLLSDSCLKVKSKKRCNMFWMIYNVYYRDTYWRVRSCLTTHLVVHPTLGALLEPQWAKDDPGDVDQLQGELLISWSRIYHSNTHNAKADDGEGAWLGAHAPAERLHHRHPDCLSKPLAHCNRKAVLMEFWLLTY